MIAEQPLAGGFVNQVTRIGHTVRRRPGANADFVHRLLTMLTAAGWSGSPRFLGYDEAGREMLEYVDGVSGVDPVTRSRVGDGMSLVRITRLVRELHDLTAGSALAGAAEVVCHHDLDPRNTIYRERSGSLVPVVIIDWDLAAPGRRIEDVARIAWQYLPLGPAIDDLDDAGRRLRLICAAYGLEQRDELIETVLWWQDRCWRGIDSAADAGDPVMVELRRRGSMREVQDAYAWTRRHQRELQARSLG